MIDVMRDGKMIYHSLLNIMTVVVGIFTAGLVKINRRNILLKIYEAHKTTA